MLIFLWVRSPCKKSKSYHTPLCQFSNGGKKRRRRRKEKNTKNSGLRHVSTKPSSQRCSDQLKKIYVTITYRSTFSVNIVNSAQVTTWVVHHQSRMADDFTSLDLAEMLQEERRQLSWIVEDMTALYMENSKIVQKIKNLAGAEEGEHQDWLTWPHRWRGTRQPWWLCCSWSEENNVDNAEVILISFRQARYNIETKCGKEDDCSREVWR